MGSLLSVGFLYKSDYCKRISINNEKHKICHYIFLLIISEQHQLQAGYNLCKSLRG